MSKELAERSDVMTFWLLRGRIIEKHKALKSFADVLEVDKNTVSNKLNGNTQFTREDIILWCALLDIPTVDIPKFFFEDIVS